MGRLLRGLVLIAAIASAGCTEPPPEPIRLGGNVWPGYEPLYLAREQGRLDPLRIKLVEFTATTETIEALRAGQIEGGMLTLDEAITLAADGIPLTIVLVFDVSNGADAIVAKPWIRNERDLVGRRIAVEHTALGAWMLSLFLDAMAIDPDEVKIVHAPIDRQWALWRADGADAFVTFEPLRSKMLDDGGWVIFDSSQTPGKIIDVLVLRQTIAEAYAERIRALRRVWLDAVRSMRADPDRAAARMAPRLDVPPAAVMRQFDGLQLGDAALNSQLLNGDPPPIRDTIRQLAATMRRDGLIARTPPPQTLRVLRWNLQ